jgi:starch synthase
MDSDQIRDMSIEVQDLLSYYDGQMYSNTIWVGWVENLKVYFVEPHHPRHFFNRGCIYGCDDDVDRFLYFSRTAVEFMFKQEMKPDIIHVHDWRTAVVPILCKDVYKSLGFTHPKTALTIHNIEYQGRCSTTDIGRIGLTDPSYKTEEKMQDPHDPKDVNLLKGAIVYSDALTTVSPNYSKEVQTVDGGKGLDKVIKKYSGKLRGILNGVDYSIWNPEIDRYLPSHYSSREMPANKKDRDTLDKKAYLKKLLRERLNLDEPHRPVVGIVTRLVPQKGIELIKHALYRTLEKNGQFILLGSSPIPSINAEFHELKHHFADHPHVSLVLHHQEELAHVIYAGSDIFIVPSIFEPCGLTQLIALKYGAVPVVRRTGGLADTIFDVDFSGKPFEETNGYTFDDPDANGVNSALDRAIKCWFEEPDKWRRLMINGMNDDYSWNHPAEAYVRMYQDLMDE